MNAGEKHLDLRGVATEFVEAGFITQRQAEDVVIDTRTSKEQGQHPFEIQTDAAGFDAVIGKTRFGQVIVLGRI